MYFIQSEKPTIKIVGEASKIAKIETKYDGETLYITSPKDKKKGNRKGKRTITKMYISSPDLTNATLSGVGDFEVVGKLNTDVLKINLEGVGDFKIHDLICDRLEVSSGGVGDADIDNAQCQSADLSLNGVGDIDVKLTKTKSTKLDLTGVGDIDVDFNDCGWASCELTGVGDITAKGSVKTFEKDKNGIGSIKSKELNIEGKASK